MTEKEKIEYSRALTEVNFILKYTDLELVNKIPRKFLEYINENEDKEYKVNISVDSSLESQKISEKTKDFMALIYRNYFCTEEERIEFDEILKKNQEQYDRLLNEKYSYENLFRKNKIEEVEENVQETKEQTALIDYENMKWYKKIAFNITNWFKTILKLR